MKKFVVCFIFLSIVFSALYANAEFVDTASLEPEKVSAISKDESSVIIKTDVPDVEIFINRIYKGKSNLTITDLLPGFYTLELRKLGYEDKSFLIQVKKGYELEFYVKMDRKFATISFVNFPENASVEVLGVISEKWDKTDGKSNYNITVFAGKHDITVKRFGYNIQTFSVEVQNNEILELKVKFEPSVFEISNVKTNKKKVNPDYAGKLGVCEFSFNVTANGNVTVSVVDENDRTLWQNTVTSFETWEQKVQWDGTDKNGERVPDGNYRVVVSSGKDSQSADFLVDSTISYPFLNVTKAGGGVGNLPAVFKNDSQFVLLNLNGNFTAKSITELFANVSAGVIYNFADHYELGVNAGTIFGTINNNILQINASVKVFDSCEIGSGSFCYGGLLRYGFTTGGLSFPDSIDYGNGLGTGALLGFDFDKFYFGITSQFILDSNNGSISFENSIWNNGVSICVKPITSVKIGVWGALNSELGGNMLASVDTGADVTFMPLSSAFFINVKLGAKVFMNYDNYYSLDVGLSYLF